MPKIQLVNRRKEQFLTTVLHEVVCAKSGSCDCAKVPRLSENGKMIQEKMPDSFHVDGMSKSAPMDSSVLHLPHVKKALADGWLERVDLPEPAAPAAPAPSASDAPPAPSRGRRAASDKE